MTQELEIAEARTPRQSRLTVTLATWTALGVTGATVATGLAGMCLLLPFIGWFIGLPIVLACALFAALFWLLGYLVIFVAFGTWELLERGKKPSS